MVYRKNEYLAREQDAPTVLLTNIAGQSTTFTMHHHQAISGTGARCSHCPTS
ncbi:MAG: hypothetical protein F6K40_28190 [Okeania sp. SIO3I5]|uniref:hypothetical protein n=1 Tax=Okeania sp. SIO3I5 TaxID=2607805 RepID=UPI0013BC19E2|nr:hypothetical protein [Okeania sp. SIO3I5]NEQ39914.1 hypothetical protein [Okeania sp. SIO3I5]